MTARKTTLALGLVALCASIGSAMVATTLNDFFLPGSQPGQSGQLETPDKCDNCHGDYNTAVEPAFNWRGGMMSQAARDPFFFASLTIANQDAADSGDLCIRCHSPAGWLEGRSFPTDGSALNNNDRQGVQCDFCHKLVKPSPLGINPYPTDTAYTTGSYPQDQSYLSKLTPIPGWSANGMYIADSNNAKRGPFIDANAKHQMFYSPFHQDAALCGTCHDVSNPAFSRQPDGSYALNTLGQPASFDNGDFDPGKMFPVERTYSEWKMSAFAAGGVDMGGRFGGNKRVVSTCQDCHLQDITGVAANKAGTPTRTDLPLHDMTGGNTFIPKTLAALWPGEVNQAALDAGITRARSMLQKAATLSASSPTSGVLRIRVVNETAHKLPSGYPEGRRIWINVKFFGPSGNLVQERGAYDLLSATLDSSSTKVYAIQPGLSADLAAALGETAGPSFHFVLNNQIFKDNRIPPRGFTNAAFAAIQSPPIGYSYADGQYWDDTDYAIPSGATYAEVRLYYQTTTREFVEFLRDENETNDWGQRLYNAWLANGQSAPELMAMTTWGTPPTDTAAPTAPTNLTATAASRLITLSWGASTDNLGVAGYYIYRNGARAGLSTTTSFNDKYLSPHTTYCYTATAFDAAGNESIFSNTACATTPRR
ncbi:MAG TPA: fibronectin type III domain-containing protein [Candidatus Xenobia bacterium]|nr:fibronectin type III domain-containing protein [Candidatus Xenobia bacterium]